MLHTGSAAEKNNAREMLEGIKRGVRAHAGRVGNSGVAILPLKIYLYVYFSCYDFVQ